MRYLLYACKSSESDDKQAQSIDDQLRELRQLATARGLDVVAELTEAKSAKTPGARPVFAEMGGFVAHEPEWHKTAVPHAFLGSHA